MTTNRDTGALATEADWTMQETVYDVWGPLLHRKPTIAVAMAGEMQIIARRYAEQYMPDVAKKLWPKDAANTRQRGRDAAKQSR